RAGGRGGLRQARPVRRDGGWRSGPQQEARRGHRPRPRRRRAQPATSGSRRIASARPAGPGYDRAMDEDIAERVYSDPVARWFVTEAYRITDTAELVAAAGEQLVRAGIPLYRLAYFQLTLHPEFAGKGYFWRRGKGVEVGIRPHGDDQDSD